MDADLTDNSPCWTPCRRRSGESVSSPAAPCTSPAPPGFPLPASCRPRLKQKTSRRWWHGRWQSQRFPHNSLLWFDIAVHSPHQTLTPHLNLRIPSQSNKIRLQRVWRHNREGNITMDNCYTSVCMFVCRQRIHTASDTLHCIQPST